MNDTLQRPTQYLSRDEIQALRRVVPWKSTLQLAHCWGTIFAVWAACIVWPHPLLIFAGVLIVGARQLGLGVLNHEAAHFLLFPNKRLNDWAAEWLCGRPLLGASVDAYRKYHLQHHKFTQQPNDPDLKLSAPFPITKGSFRRKAIRDLTGQTFFKQRVELFKRVMGSKDDSLTIRLGRLVQRFGSNFAINAAFLAVFALAGHWYLYILLWVLPDFTWHAFISRVRNIGEHGAVPDDNDRLRNTRTTLANRLERLLIAPYFVNYHLEHHLLVSCPCYHLPRMHKLLMAKGLGAQMELKMGYIDMLTLAVSKPERAAAH